MNAKPAAKQLLEPFELRDLTLANRQSRGDSAHDPIASVKASYERAVASGSYESVERNNGKTERAYGMINHKEYFAESSEAFLGTNDFFPFNRVQLKRHDPQMETLLSKLWATGE